MTKHNYEIVWLPIGDDEYIEKCTKCDTLRTYDGAFGLREIPSSSV